jgi:hypothetical protein
MAKAKTTAKEKLTQKVFSVGGIILRKRKNSDGTSSLFLDIWHNGKRKYEFLKHLKLSNRSNPADRQTDKENTELAKKIAIKKAQEYSANDFDVQCPCEEAVG